MSQSPRQMPNSLGISNTKLAACLTALGFPCDCKPLYDTKSDTGAKTFLFGLPSIRAEFSGVSVFIAKQYESGALEAAEPMHPLCIMMRAQHNYDRILEMHRGACMNLRSVAGGRMTIYRRHSELDPDSKFIGRVPCDDLALAASLAGVGLPVRDFEGHEGERRYWLPQHGYPVIGKNGQPHLEHADLLMRRSPTAADPLRLALEVTDPLHPVCLGYDALFSRVVLKRLLQERDPFLHIRSDDHFVLVAADHRGRVMDEIAKRIGAPPL